LLSLSKLTRIAAGFWKIWLCMTMSIVMLKRKGERVGAGSRGEVGFESSWPSSKAWVQVLRPPGEHATVCYLGMDFAEEDEHYHRRYVDTGATQF
jgi:hypothetical protein